MWTCECADLFLFHENGIALVFMLPFFFSTEQKILHSHLSATTFLMASLESGDAVG